MATGLIATQDVTSQNTNTTVYQVPTGKVASISIKVVNRNAGTNAAIRLALSTSDTPANGDWIEYDKIVYAEDSYYQPGIVLAQDQYVVIRSDQTSVNVVVWGFEEDAA